MTWWEADVLQSGEWVSFDPLPKVGDTVVVVPWGWTEVVIAVNQETAEWQLATGAWYSKEHLRVQ